MQIDSTWIGTSFERQKGHCHEQQSPLHLQALEVLMPMRHRACHWLGTQGCLDLTVKELLRMQHVRSRACEQVEKSLCIAGYGGAHE